MKLKETTMTSWLMIITATILVALKLIGPEWWATAVGAAGLSKGLQGAADRFKPNSAPSTR